MKYIVLFLLFSLSNAINLKVTDCPTVKANEIKFHACDVEAYSRVYFHDPTGENQITVIPGRLYKNHGFYVAYSSENKLFIATEKHPKKAWFSNYDLITKL